MICQCLADQLFAAAFFQRLRQIIDLLSTDKSQYFAQPQPIIADCIVPPSCGTKLDF